MNKTVRSPIVHTPHSIQEFFTLVDKYPGALVWAGGTYIMSRPGYYPAGSSSDIITLDSIQDLKHTSRSDRFLEVGSMVTLNQLLNTGSQVLPPLLIDALVNTSSSAIRRNATLGGALATKGSKTSIACVLSVIDAWAEVRTADSGISPLGPHWVRISRLYDKSGNFIPPNNALLCKVRISLAHPEKEFRYFRMFRSPVRNAEEAVLLAIRAGCSSSNVTTAKTCLVFPTSCYLCSEEVESIILSSHYPLSAEASSDIIEAVRSALKYNNQDTGSLQVNRALNLFRAALSELNKNFIK